MVDNKVFNGDCRNVLRQFPDNSFDSVVTDPPYDLTSPGAARRSALPGHYDGESFGRGNKKEKQGKGFMGKEWDGTGIAFKTETWKEVFRVLKPGGHLLAFGGTRTYHRMACAIEDAGFEIRDRIQWLYGTGFPKSQDISKMIDKKEGKEREIIGEKQSSGMLRNGRTNKEMSDKWSDQNRKPNYITTPSTDEAKQWQGFGTALKPANEPICLARKPLSEKTVAANVLKWGTAGLNIDKCRIPTTDKLGGGMLNGTTPASDGWDRPWRHNPEVAKVKALETSEKVAKAEQLGRFPANVIFSEEAAAELDRQSGKTVSKSGGFGGNDPGMWAGKKKTARGGHNDSGGASRFFYTAKASKLDRAGSKHPTIKPLNLIRYLCRLITPPGGIVLDPFGGSGTTLQAAHEEGFGVVVIEKEMEYCDDILNRTLVME